MRNACAALVVALGVWLAPGGASAQETPPPSPPVSANDGTLIYNFGQHPLVVVAEGTLQVTSENSTVSPRSGYMPMQVALRNSGKEAETVRLEFTYRGTSSATIRRVVEVPAASRKVVTIPIPAGATYGVLEASAKGIKEGGTESLYFTQAQQAILALGTEEQFQDVARCAPDYNSYATYVRAIPPGEAPTELAAYVGFNEVVLLTPPEELDAAACRAIEAYAATGGTVFVTRPSRALPSYFPLLKDAAPGLYPYGFGNVRVCSEEPLACALALNTDLTLAQKIVKPVAASTYVNRYAYGSAGNAIPEKERFLLPQATAPVGRFLLIILAFTLAIGPGSVWVARRRGPPMLLLTIPATAFVTCLLIVGYSVLVDGFAIHAATRGYTLLDGKNKRAITVGMEAFYANIAPGEASWDVLAAIIGPQVDYNSDQIPSIDWTRGATFDTDFIPSRTYREWGVVSVAPTRARLLVKRLGDGSIEVQNALGSDITVARVNVDQVDYFVRDVRDGGSRRAEPVAPGAAVQDASLQEFNSRFDSRVGLRIREPLREGEFLAQLEGPALLPVGGLRLSHHSSAHLVRGEVER
ncbi:MAG: hypothetical protein IRZ16_02965 [Myxococcaceae bacterium]|nr:hypothetical protein [Myxococcaceae bacterium]